MGGGQVKQVGGGPATGLADAFTSFLKQGLSSGHFGSGGAQNNGSGYPGYTGSGPNVGPGPTYEGSSRPTWGYGDQSYLPRQHMPVRNNLNPGQQTANVDPTRQTQGFGDVIDSLMNGGGLSNPNYGVDTSGLKGMSGTDIPFNPTNYSRFSGLKGVDFSKFDPSVGKMDFSQFSNGANNITRTGNLGGLPTAPNVNINSGTATGIDPNNPAFKAIQDLTSRQQAHDKAATNARFGMGGGGGFGTGAAYASSELAARQPAEMAKALSDIDLQYRDRDLSNRALGVQASTATGQLQTQQFQTLVDAATKGDATAAAMLNNIMQGQLTARGQDVVSKGQGLDALKSASQQNTDLTNIDLSGARYGDLSNQAGANIGLQNKGLNIDALSKALGFDLSGQGLDLNSKIAGAGISSDMIRNLMQQFGQLSDKGIPQAQMIQQPSFFQNLIGGLTGIAGAISPFAKGGFGGGGFSGGSTATVPGGVSGGGGIPTGNGDNTFMPDSNIRPNYFGGSGLTFSTGGQVPGTGSGDTVHAMLEPGEVVLNKRAVSVLGEDFLNKINTLTKKFKKGQSNSMPQNFAFSGGM